MKRPAFQFYPADWVGSRWVAYDYGQASYLLPRKPCCYAIYLDGRLSYIGQATDFAKRMSSHGLRVGYGASILTKWGPFKSVVVKARFSTHFGDWAMREARLIERLQPPLNCAGVSRQKGVR